MIKICCIAFISLWIHAYTSTIDLEYVRANYAEAVFDKQLCNQMIDALKPKTTPLCMAYLGGLQTIRAKHVFNPFRKLSTFNKGKKNIEAAVKADPDNAEIRFIRLSVQKYAPSFLYYNSMIKTDEIFLSTHRKNIASSVVQQEIDKLLESEK